MTIVALVFFALGWYARGKLGDWFDELKKKFLKQ